MKKKKAASTGVGRAVFVGFFMTMIVCCFFLFSGVALWNTTQNLFGSGTPLVEMNSGRSEKPELTVRVIDTVYEVDLSELNRVSRFCQEHYPLLPRGIRTVGYLTEELNRGLELIRKKQEQSESDGKIFCQNE